ncbi:STAS-like domain-containing protein [Paraburkholderia sp. RL17-373-BIF-A]|uniref:STAS-like domain-containing protein n=1 Tax=Paraburkholderia sp. RL17-373-BIF-A TaxID=3031629 RepID=UPI0038B6D6D5
MKLNIQAEVGSRCIVAEDGQRIHDLIIGALKDGENVFLDFENVRQFASPFFNFSVGQLLSDVSEETLRNLLHLENLNDVGRLVVERVIANASKYQGNEDYKKIVDDILERQAKGDADAR